MSQEITYRCDECKTPKGSGNHWFKAITGHDTLVMSVFAFHAPVNDPGERTVLHLCSESCVISRMSKVMGEFKKASDADAEAERWAKNVGSEGLIR